MDWRWLLPLPLAAFLCGEAVHAPVAREILPAASPCAAYAEAKQTYLLAYGFAREEPAAAAQLRAQALGLLLPCTDEAAALLKGRAESLSIGSGPHLNP